jgi:hypothetical protein
MFLFFVIQNRLLYRVAHVMVSGVEPWLPEGITSNHSSPYFDSAQYDRGFSFVLYGLPFHHVILTKEGSKQKECFPLPYNLFTLFCLDTKKLQKRSSPTEPFPPALKDQRKSSETGFKTILLLINFYR